MKNICNLYFTSIERKKHSTVYIHCAIDYNLKTENAHHQKKSNTGKGK